MTKVEQWRKICAELRDELDCEAAHVAETMRHKHAVEVQGMAALVGSGGVVSSAKWRTLRVALDFAEAVLRYHEREEGDDGQT